MKISKNKVISLSYTTTASKENGVEELIEQVRPDSPHVYLFGYGGVPPDFDKKLKTKRKGDKFDFWIKAEDAFGKYEKNFVMKVGRKAFIVNDKFDDRVKVGENIEMRDAKGNELIGKVMQIAEEFVMVDFNHPLAGYNLHIVGEVLDIRKATREEINHKSVQGP